MSFSSEIKQEIAYNDLKDCCKKAELCALLEATAALVMREGQWGLLINTENPTTAKRIMQLLKDSYDVKTDLLRYKKTSLKKNYVYTIHVLEKGVKILKDLSLYDHGLLDHPRSSLLSKDCCARAYLAGTFLASGSCNSYKKSDYHLEISANSLELATFIQKLLRRFNIEAKIMTRRKKEVIYLKKADAISDFLRLSGAHEALMNFENARISRDFKNSLTRLDNCEIANEEKLIKKANEQLKDIKLLKDHGQYDKLDERLKEVCELRLKYEDYSLKELCDMFEVEYGEVISKSGLKHRLDKVKAIADKIKEREGEANVRSDE